MVSSFLKYLEYEKRCSKHTLSSYRNDLNQFDQFVKSYPEPGTVTSASHQHIRAWLITLLEKGLVARTVNRKIAALRSYYKYALKHDIIEKDPSRKVRVLKAAKNLPVFAQETEILKTLDQLVYQDGFEGARDKLVIEFLYGTGTRLSELINLNEQDLNLTNKLVKVLGKRNKERIIPIPSPLVEVIASYLELKRDRFSNNYSPYLIVNNKGDQSYPMMVYRIVKSILLTIPSLEKQSPHILRHTFATHLLNKGAELNAVKELLGHASLAATQVYTHNTIDRLKKVFDQSHPKA